MTLLRTLRLTVATGTVSALTLAGVMAGSAHAATLNTADYCPAGGVINTGNLAGLKLPNTTAAELAEGISIVETTQASGSEHYTYRSYEYFSPSKNQYSVHDAYANARYNGTGEVRSYDFTQNKRYTQFSNQLASPYMRKGVKLLKKTSLWVAEAPEANRATVLQRQLNYNLSAAGWIPENLKSGSTKSLTCTTTPTSVTYAFAFTSGNTVTNTIDLRDDGAPLGVQGLFTPKGGAFTETRTTTITYGDAAASLIMPAAGTAFTPVNTWRSAHLKAGLLSMKTDETGWAKQFVAKAKTKSARIAAIRKAARRNLAFITSDYFWYSYWTPTVHVSNVTGGAKVWATDPQTHKQLWFTMKLTGTKTVTVTKNLP